MTDHLFDSTASFNGLVQVGDIAVETGGAEFLESLNLQNWQSMGATVIAYNY